MNEPRVPADPLSFEWLMFFNHSNDGASPEALP
jgi:hypothetical protein